MAGSTILETAVNEVIDRMRRLESCIASLSLNSTNAQHNQFNVINQVNVQIQQLQIEQRCMFGSMQTEQRTLFDTLQREMSEQSRSPLINGTIPATPITTAMQPEIKEPSPDNACGFPDCNFRASSKRPCSALQSLRHMVTCSFCPESRCRFLSIAQHMLTKRAPRVTHVQDCCWCGCGFTDLLKEIDSADHRVRHRKSCLAATIAQLQSHAEHDETVSRLTEIWSTDLNDAEVGSPSAVKRVREAPYSPIAAVPLQFAKNVAALTVFAADDLLHSAFAADDLTHSAFATDD
jgi:hypothetical protein